MKKTFVLLILISTCFQLIGQEIYMSGAVTVYFSKKIPKTLINPPDMYCLDSIRVVCNDSIIPLECEYLSSEEFAYKPSNGMSRMINTTIRNSSLYCKNPLQNRILKGGEIFKNKGEKDRLYISFNISGKVYKVIPYQNSINKGDSLTSLIEYQKRNFYDGEEMCRKTINYHAYFILLKDFISTKLTDSQKKTMKFRDAGINEFWRYGCW
jgi:hypothetical protein